MTTRPPIYTNIQKNNFAGKNILLLSRIYFRYTLIVLTQLQLFAVLKIFALLLPRRANFSLKTLLFCLYYIRVNDDFKLVWEC